MIASAWCHSIIQNKAGNPAPQCQREAPMAIAGLSYDTLTAVWNSGAAMFALLLFLPAATLHWWRAWLLLGVIFIGMVGAVFRLARGHEGLLKERLRPPLQKGQPLADKIIVVLYGAAIFGLMVFIPLDVFRFHLMGKPGTLVSSLGLVLLVAGW
jgi:hypothetical protein